MHGIFRLQMHLAYLSRSLATVHRDDKSLLAFEYYRANMRLLKCLYSRPWIRNFPANIVPVFIQHISFAAPAEIS